MTKAGQNRPKQNGTEKIIAIRRSSPSMRPPRTECQDCHKGQILCIRDICLIRTMDVPLQRLDRQSRRCVERMGMYPKEQLDLQDYRNQESAILVHEGQALL